MPPIRQPHPVVSTAGFDRRTIVVWVALIASMTFACSVLLLLNPRPLAPAGNLALAVVDTEGQGLQRIFDLPHGSEMADWQYIVIHHTGQSFGNAQSLGNLHQELGYGGLGYHFLIGNGNGAADGQIQVGYRWLKQAPSVYAKNAVSIALVGNGDESAPTEAQMQQLIRLVTHLQNRLNIPPHRVVLHRDIAQTTSPGRLFPTSRFRRLLLD